MPGLLFPCDYDCLMHYGEHWQFAQAVGGVTQRCDVQAKQ